MRLSTDPHIAAIQRNCINSRRAWMSSARVHASSFRNWGSGFAASSVRNAVVMARRASRSSWQINKG